MRLMRALLDLIAVQAVILSLEQNLLDALTVVEMINFNSSQDPPDHLARVQAAFRKYNIKAEVHICHEGA